MRALYSSTLYISNYKDTYMFNWRVVGEKIHIVYNDFNFPLKIKEGDFWLIEEQELHRFRTDLSKSEMIVIAFHPDSEWGPTDYNHTMLNRTYIKK